MPQTPPLVDPASARQLLDAATDVGASAKALFQSMQGAAGLTRHTVSDIARRHPYGLLGASAGAGFILSGGLSAPITRSLVNAGIKAATIYAVDVALGALATVEPAHPSQNPTSDRGNHQGEKT